MKELETEKAKWKDTNTKEILTLKEENIAEVVSAWTGIPVSKVSEDESKKLKNLEENLHKRVIGQNEAVEKVTEAIMRSRAGIGDPKKPIGSFMFLGPTGVRKDRACKSTCRKFI